MLPAPSTIAKLNNCLSRIAMCIHAWPRSIGLPVLAASAEIPLQFAAAPARTPNRCAGSPLFSGRPLWAPYRGLVSSNSSAPAIERRFRPRLSRVCGAQVAGNARVERGAQARKPIRKGCKVHASAHRFQCPSLNKSPHGTGRSGFHVFNYRAWPARELSR